MSLYSAKMRTGHRGSLWKDSIVSAHPTIGDGKRAVSCSYEARRDFPRGPLDECPGLFLPDRLLETSFRVLPSPMEDELKAIAFLAWETVQEASQFYTSTKIQLQQQREEDLKREAWKLHPLYQES